MLMHLAKPVNRKLFMNNVPCARNLFQRVLNKVFNAVDENRRDKLGPDRSCAEWLLRNGASVKFKDSSEFLSDYNSLPNEDFPVKIVEVEAVNSSISSYGFGHFKGCQLLWKIVFNRCYLLENESMKELHFLKESLRYLKISNCPDITDDGLFHLQGLKLTNLELYNLPYVRDKQSVIRALESSLPNCNIIFK